MAPNDSFDDLFRSARRSVLRLENRRHTDIEGERQRVRAFLADDLPEVRELSTDAWTEMVAMHAAAGRPFCRVRVVEDPLTDYNRYMIYSGSRNVAAGEDVRYLSRAAANALDLPDHDFWVFDALRMAELRFTEDGRYLGHDLITDKEIVMRHEEWIRRAITAAIPSAEYVAQDPTRAWPPVRLAKAAKGA